ncbi:hypothetical protein BD410DRAFT_846637 [Rickenella mellea]|uniref:Uncharacterized protein n=1 Tax=Rickenella mellea TaxID=50990 RepID=A0A4Y7PEI9_9AGAM|nr:hypothetical protein BD410DRAFT_846637 [Rickenella mellea]
MSIDPGAYEIQNVTHRSLNEHIQLLKDMKLRDELIKASGSAGVLDINVALDTIQQERARLEQAEFKLMTSVETAQLERARHTWAEDGLRESHQAAYQQERERHLQAEAELRTYYKKLLAERDQRVREAEKRRCICM